MTCIGCRTGQQQIRMAQEPYALKKPVNFQTGKQNRLQTARYNRLTTGKAKTPISYQSFRKKSIPTGTSQVQPTPQTEPIPPQVEPVTPVQEITPQYYSHQESPNYQELFNQLSVQRDQGGNNLGWLLAFKKLVKENDGDLGYNVSNEEILSNLRDIAKTQTGTKTFTNNNLSSQPISLPSKRYYTDLERKNEISYTDIPEQYRKNIKPILYDGGNINYLKIFMDYGK